VLRLNERVREDFTTDRIELRKSRPPTRPAVNRSESVKFRARVARATSGGLARATPVRNVYTPNRHNRARTRVTTNDERDTKWKKCATRPFEQHQKYPQAAGFALARRASGRNNAPRYEREDSSRRQRLAKTRRTKMSRLEKGPGHRRTLRFMHFSFNRIDASRVVRARWRTRCKDASNASLSLMCDRVWSLKNGDFLEHSTRPISYLSKTYSDAPVGTF